MLHVRYAMLFACPDDECDVCVCVLCGWCMLLLCVRMHMLRYCTFCYAHLNICMICLTSVMIRCCGIQSSPQVRGLGFDWMPACCIASHCITPQNMSSVYACMWLQSWYGVCVNAWRHMLSCYKNVCSTSYMCVMVVMRMAYVYTYVTCILRYACGMPFHVVRLHV